MHRPVALLVAACLAGVLSVVLLTGDGDGDLPRRPPPTTIGAVTPPSQPTTRVPVLGPAMPLGRARRRPVVVARSHGVILRAFDRGGQLCLQMSVGGAESECRRPTGTLRETATGGSFSGSEGEWTAGFVAPQVRFVELVPRRGRSIRLRTTRAPYRGRYAAFGRFFLAGLPAEDPREIGQLRLLDATGRLLAVQDETGPYDVGPRRLVARERGYAVRLQMEETSDPFPGDEDRVARYPCIDVLPAGVEDEEPDGFQGPGLGTCVQREVAGTLHAALSPSCEARRMVIAGSLPETGEPRLVLGDGRRRALPVYRLHPAEGGGRVFAGLVGPEAAVREVVLVRDGAIRDSSAIDEPPLRFSCALPRDGSVAIYLRDEPKPRPTGPGLHIEERSGGLCVTSPGPQLLDPCPKPPVEWHEATAVAFPQRAPTFAGGVVPEEVRAVDVKRFGAPDIRVATTPVGREGGRWAGRVRRFDATLPTTARVRLVVLRDRRGRFVGEIGAGDEGVVPSGPRRTLLRGAAGAVVSGGPGRDYKEKPAYCLRFAAPGTGRARCEGFPALGLDVTCEPRGMRLWGAVDPGVRGLRLLTDRGSRAAGLRTVPGQSVRAALLTLPGDAAPRRLVISETGRRDRSIPFALPAADDQCGYTALSLPVAPR